MKRSEYPNISYAIPVCDEHVELAMLLNQLNAWIDESDQIVVQTDTGKVTKEVLSVIDEFAGICKSEFKTISFKLNNDFAAFKNNLKSHCTGRYVFQIDADELLGDSLLMNLPVFLHDNSEIDLFYIPRINIVEGITEEYAHSQHWNLQKIEFPIASELNEHVINFPDRQARLFKNLPEIKWRNRVHEVITGHKSYVDMASGLRELDAAQIQSWCLVHIKEIERQVKQNEAYSQILKNQYD